MDPKIVFVKTKKGDDEINSTTSHLYGDVKRVLVLIDEQSTVKELRKRAAPSLRAEMDALFQELLIGGFIQNQNMASKLTSPNMSSPVKISNPKPSVPKESDESSLDFTGLIAAPISSIAIPPGTVNMDAEKEVLKTRLENQHKKEKKMAAAALLKAEQEAAARLRAAQEAEAARLKAEQEAARIKAAAHEAEMVRIKIEAETKARAAQEAEQAEQKAREAERARIQTEAALAKARIAEEAEARAKLEAEQAQAAARTIQEARVAAEAEAKAAEEIRLRAEAQSKKSRAEANEFSSDVASLNAADRLKQGKEDNQTQKLAETRAKSRPEADQRAATQAQQTTAPLAQRVPRSPRRPLPVVKISLMLIILAVSAIFLLPFVMPMETYIKQTVQTLSTQLKQPVKIGAMHANLLPMPTLELKNVEIGNPTGAQVESVVLNFNWLTVFSPAKEITKVEINGLAINANFFGKAMPLFAAAGRDALFPVQRMVLQGISIKGFELPPTNGVLDFNSQGELTKVVLNTENKIIRVQLQPVEKSGQGNWKFGLLLRDGHLPLLPEILFTELNVGGLVSLSEANINEIEGFLYGGKLTGSTRVTWDKGWQMLGQLHLSNLELQEAMPQLGMMGKLGGDANLNFHADSLTNLMQSPKMHAPRMTGKFVVKKGAINAFDLVDVTSGNAAGSGRTHFEEVNGTWQVTDGNYQLRQIKIAGGMMSANGSIDLLADKKLSGKLNVALQAREEMGNVPVLLTGTLAKPELQVGAN
ncbi:MAG: AsmA family protein [Candidatus Nitrotoga sp.]